MVVLRCSICWQAEKQTSRRSRWRAEARSCRSALRQKVRCYSPVTGRLSCARTVTFQPAVSWYCWHASMKPPESQECRPRSPRHRSDTTGQTIEGTNKNQSIGCVPYFANARRLVPDCTVSFTCVADRISDVRQRTLSLAQSVRCPQREQAITVPIRDDERNARGLPK